MYFAKNQHAAKTTFRTKSSSFCAKTGILSHFLQAVRSAEFGSAKSTTFYAYAGSGSSRVSLKVINNFWFL